MAKLKRDSINLSMFFALKVSEKSGVPVMFLSNPGIGKSTTVEMFAEIRGYELLLLRGNSTTAEEINGYDSAGAEAEKTKAATHLRPSWFQTILKNSEEGKKTLLFLDEITTTDDRVQAALLHLVFDRMVDKEPLPKDTLIVSAGNYAQNLSDSMDMLPPTLNRFMLYNIEIFSDDLDIFMNKYQGSNIGKRYDYMEDLKKTMIEMDKQEIVATEDYKNRVGEYVEKGILDSVKFLISEKQIDMNVKELKNIYVESSEDAKLNGKVYGFVTPRTMNFLREVTIQTFLCFGKSGITGKNFKNAIDGLCGIGLTKDPKSSEVKMNLIGGEIFSQIQSVVNDIEKMKNDKLPHYVDFFREVLDKGKKDMDNSLIQSIINKVNELNVDPDLETISRPIDPTIISDLYNLTNSVAANIFGKIKIDPKVDIKDLMSVEEAAGLVNSWNLISELLTSVGTVVLNKKFDYTNTTIKQFESQPARFNPHRMKIAGIRNYFVNSDVSLGNIIPEMKSIIVKK